VSESVAPEVNISDASLDADVAEATDAQTDDTVERVVAFMLDGQRYALPIGRVREIQQIVAFSDVPAGGAGVVGMVNLRGQVIPAVDMRQLLGLPSREYNLETPMVIAETRGKLVAMIVDEVRDVFELPPGCMQDAPTLHQLASKMIGVARLGDGLVYVLDLDLLFDADLFERAGGR
jgi:chemotaxis signal transduction protein